MKPLPSKKPGLYDLDGGFANRTLQLCKIILLTDAWDLLRKRSGGGSVLCSTTAWKRETLDGFGRASTKDIPHSGRAFKNLPDFRAFQSKRVAGLSRTPDIEATSPGTHPARGMCDSNWPPSEARLLGPQGHRFWIRCFSELRRSR